MRSTLLSIQFYKGDEHYNGHHGDNDDHDHHDDHHKRYENMSILLKSRSIGFSGVFWVYSAASLVMALYAYLVKTTILSFFSYLFDQTNIFVKITVTIVQIKLIITEREFAGDT